MDWSKIEKFSDSMERWHNRVFRVFWVICFFGLAFISGVANITMIFYFDELVNSYDASDDDLALFHMIRVALVFFNFVVVIGFLYVMLFMGFRFPIGFKGDGSGRKQKPPYARQ